MRTSGHLDMHDITAQVAKIVKKSGVRTGVAHIFNVGSTAVVGTIKYEPGLEKDLPGLLARLIPPCSSIPQSISLGTASVMRGDALTGTLQSEEFFP
jgi:thiamine phosphate synthase YjbQ (UPF0047 family)